MTDGNLHDNIRYRNKKSGFVLPKSGKGKKMFTVIRWNRFCLESLQRVYSYEKEWDSGLVCSDKNVFERNTVVRDVGL